MYLVQAASNRSTARVPRIAGLLVCSVAGACSVASPRPSADFVERLAAVIAAPSAISAPADATGDWFVEPGVGVTFGPDTLLLALTTGRTIDGGFAVGPALQLGLDDHETFFAPTLNVRREFALSDGDLSRVAPYIEAGAGIAYLEKERRGRGDDDEVGLLLTAGLGANVRLDGGVAVGSGVVVDLMPTELVGERVLVAWRVVQLQFRF